MERSRGGREVEYRWRVGWSRGGEEQGEVT